METEQWFGNAAANRGAARDPRGSRALFQLGSNAEVKDELEDSPAYMLMQDGIEQVLFDYCQ